MSAKEEIKLNKNELLAMFEKKDKQEIDNQFDEKNMVDNNLLKSDIFIYDEETILAVESAAAIESAAKKRNIDRERIDNNTPKESVRAMLGNKYTW